MVERRAEDDSREMIAGLNAVNDGCWLSELRRRSALEEMIQQNATQKLFRQEFLKGTYDLMKVL
jgi:hypothetical protein